MDYGHVGSIYSDKIQQHYLKYWIQNKAVGTYYFSSASTLHFNYQSPPPFCFTRGDALPISMPLPHHSIVTHIHNLHIYFLDHSPPKLCPSNPQTPYLAHPRAPLAKGKTAMVSHTQHWCLLSYP